MVWPDGGIGMPHEHPYWSKCTICPAWPGWKQSLGILLLNPIAISLFLLMLILLMREG